MSPRRRHRGLRAVVWAVPLYCVLLVLAAAEDLVRHSLAVAVLLVALPLAGFLLGRLSVAGFKRLGDRRGASLVELRRLRGLVAELEHAAGGRPIETILASYRAVGRRYGGSQ